MILTSSCWREAVVLQWVLVGFAGVLLSPVQRRDLRRGKKALKKSPPSSAESRGDANEVNLAHPAGFSLLLLLVLSFGLI